MKREIELDFIRVAAMLMIILDHILSEANVKWGEFFNVGVMVFLFMSGYLSFKADYDKKWIANRLKRILPEYYIFLVFYFLALLLLKADFSLKQLAGNILLLQGVFTDCCLPNILHLWFLSYLLICYSFTPLVVRFFKKADTKKMLIVAVAIQFAVIPLKMIGVGIVFSRFAAYFLGLYMAMKQQDGEKFPAYRQAAIKMSLPVLSVNAVRFTMELSGIQDQLPKAVDMAFGLLWQWANMFLGIFLFFVLWCAGHKLMDIFSDSQKRIVLSLSAGSYCVYIVHQVFVYHEYAITRFVSPYPVALALALVCIAVSACILYFLSNGVRKLLARSHLCLEDSGGIREEYPS